MADSVFEEKLETKHYNYLVFWTPSLPMKVSVGENSEYVNLGDWITYFTYGCLTEKLLKIREVIHWDKYHEKSR
jgi:UDP-2,3-diacylglucosamine hydrolase